MNSVGSDDRSPTRDEPPRIANSSDHTPQDSADLLLALPLSDLEQDPTVISVRPVAAPAEFVRSLSLVELAKSLEGRQLDHFAVGRMIGGGGMGAVFRGRDLRLDRDVAIKVIPESRRDPETLRRFRTEAQSAARLDHPNIARVYDIGEDETWNYIVFEFIDGINLRDLVQVEGPMGIDDAVFTTRQVAEALQHANDRDVVHRDVKPSNVIITPTGVAKVVDMGLARNTALDRSTADQTASGVTLGTFDYISPEQARDPRDADVRSDLYSLGCTLFYMLTGQAPFPDGTALQKLLNHGSQAPPDPRQWRDDISDQLYAVLAKLMAKRPSDRYQKPLELINDLLLIAQLESLPRSRTAGTILLRPTIAQRSLLEIHLPWMVSLAVLLVTAFWLQSANSLTALLELPTPTLRVSQTGDDASARRPAPSPRTNGSQASELRSGDLFRAPPASPSVATSSAPSAALSASTVTSTAETGGATAGAAPLLPLATTSPDGSTLSPANGPGIGPAARPMPATSTQDQSSAPANLPVIESPPSSNSPAPPISNRPSASIDGAAAGPLRLSSQTHSGSSQLNANGQSAEQTLGPVVPNTASPIFSGSTIPSTVPASIPLQRTGIFASPERAIGETALAGAKLIEMPSIPSEASATGTNSSSSTPAIPQEVKSVDPALVEKGGGDSGIARPASLGGGLPLTTQGPIAGPSTVSAADAAVVAAAGGSPNSQAALQPSVVPAMRRDTIVVQVSQPATLASNVLWCTSLSEALAQAKAIPEVQVIEVHESMELDHAITVPRSGLTLRAAADKVIELTFSGAKAYGMGWESWFEVGQFGLQCEGLRLTCKNDMRQTQAIFELRSGGRLALNDCVVTMADNGQAPLGNAILISERESGAVSGRGAGSNALTKTTANAAATLDNTLTATSGNVLGAGLSGSPSSDLGPVSISLRRTIIRGNQTLVAMRTACRSEITIDHCSAMVDGRVLTIRAVDLERMPPVVRMSMDQSTFACGQGFALVQTTSVAQRAPLTLMRTSKLCAFWSPRSVPHVTLDGIANLETLDQLLQLRGEENAYDQNTEILCQCRFADGKHIDFSFRDATGEWFRERGNDNSLRWEKPMPPDRGTDQQVPDDYRLQSGMFVPGIPPDHLRSTAMRGLQAGVGGTTAK